MMLLKILAQAGVEEAVAANAFREYASFENSLFNHTWFDSDVVRDVFYLHVKNNRVKDVLLNTHLF